MLNSDLRSETLAMWILASLVVVEKKPEMISIQYTNRLNCLPCVLRNGSRCLMRLRKVACWLHPNHKHHMAATQLMRNMKSQEWERTGTVSLMLNTICYCHLLIYLFYRFNKAKLNGIYYCIPVLQCFRDAELLKIL